MKKFIIVILLFLLPLFCLLAILEYGMRTVPNDYIYKNNWLTNHIDDVQIWTLGSSHALYGISPKHFSKKAFNSAHVSQSFRYDEFIFNKFVDNATALQYLILPISYFSMSYDIEAGQEKWRIKNYTIYYDCTYHKSEHKYNYEVIMNPKPINKQIARVAEYWMYGKNDIKCDSLGLGLEYSKDRREKDWYLNGCQRVKRHSVDLNERRAVIQNNTSILESIISKCANRNIQVILLILPTCNSYYNCVDSAQYNLMINTCQNLVQRHNNVTYLNLFKDQRFVEDDFFDVDHLETQGAAKLTQILDEYIR